MRAAELREGAILVTGAGGFLGSSIVRRLLDMGVEPARVRALVAAPGASFFAPPAGVSAHRCEIDDRDALVALMVGVTSVVHAAGPSSVAASFERPAEFARAHTVGTSAVFEACARASVARLVHVSSAEVYGQPQSNPVTEDHPLQPRSPYGAAKVGAELVLRTARWSGTAVILRPFSVYGPRQVAASLLSAILRQVRGEPRVVLADLRPVRDYCFVEDVADAALRALTVALPEGAPPLVCNVASGVGTSVADLARLAMEAAGRALPLREDPSRRRPGGADILHMVADVTRARDALGWSARVDLVEGLRRTLASLSEGVPL